jgi:hypothetical protein
VKIKLALSLSIWHKANVFTTTQEGLQMRYRKIGGLHFVQIGRLTFSFCISKPKNKKLEQIKQLKRRIVKAKQSYKMGLAL